MKYKNIPSAIHNIGQSFLSLMNYVDDGYIVDELVAIHREGHDIWVDWIAGHFEPQHRAGGRIEKSVQMYRAELRDRLLSQNVELERLRSVALHWPAGGRRFMEAEDDRGRKHKIYVSEIK